MKYNNVSVMQVISKVLADLDVSDENQRISDYIEWACEAVELIGAPVQLDTVSGKDSEPIQIIKYQGELPTDIVTLMSVMYSTSEDGLYTKIFPSTHIGGAAADGRSFDIKYSIKPGYVNLNIPDGFVKVIYKRLHLDMNGVPVIPDLMSYIEAIYWYIVMKLTYPMWRIGKIRDAVYYDAKKSWNFFKNKAYGEIMMPTYDEYARNVKNAYSRLVPYTNAEKSDLSHIGERESILE